MNFINPFRCTCFLRYFSQILFFIFHFPLCERLSSQAIKLRFPTTALTHCLLCPRMSQNRPNNKKIKEINKDKNGEMEDHKKLDNARYFFSPTRISLHSFMIHRQTLVALPRFNLFSVSFHFSRFEDIKKESKIIRCASRLPFNALTLRECPEWKQNAFFMYSLGNKTLFSCWWMSLYVNFISILITLCLSE